MAIQLRNGSIVHRVWPDGSNELLAQFQYSTAADEFCRAPRDNCTSWMVRTCLYSGEMRIFKTEAPTQPANEGDE